MSQMSFLPEKLPETILVKTTPVRSIPWEMAEELREQLLALYAIMDQEVDLELRPIYEGLLREYGTYASLVADQAFMDKLRDEIITLRIKLDLIWDEGEDMAEVFSEGIQHYERLCDQYWSITGRSIG